MAKIPVIVSYPVTAHAEVTVDVEEHIDGIYNSIEDRAKKHVEAALAIGADVPWQIKNKAIPAKINVYQLSAEVDPAFKEVDAGIEQPPASPPPTATEKV